MNNREIFDKVKAHLLSQGKRSYSTEIHNCAYRGPAGAKCAVGCLITDEAYSLGLENMNVNTDEVIRALSESGVDVGDLSTLAMLQQLQELHDNEAVNAWGEKLAEIERRYFG